MPISFKRPSAAGSGPRTQTAFRLSIPLLERVDALVERRRAEFPGVNFTRADIVRSLLTVALDLEDAKRGKLKDR